MIDKVIARTNETEEMAAARGQSVAQMLDEAVEEGTAEKLPFEAPILTSKCTAPLSADMVMSIDIPIFFAPWGGLRVEDGFLVKAGGAA